ncbi:transcription factor bHLH111-like [Curcuma longa]|uniref:transcription factor bHLH111-like n=1 Tax=Curcuma longa TaxID=136217 RepID=UPI003D9F1FD0
MMLQLLESSAAAAMWNETVFPSLSPPPGHSFGNGEAWLQSSNNASMELERLVNCGKFFNGLQDNYGEFSFDRHAFSPIHESNSGIFPENCYGDEVKETAGSLDMGEGRKLLAIRDPTNKHEATFSTTPHQSKRLKTSYSKQQKTTTIPGIMPLSKVPVRRSQKLGDKITALQQLVSPFGKTDTASVLHEAALSIKFMHDQIEMLTTPYTGIGSSHSHHQGHAESNSSTGNLRKRGLCLVPIYTILGLNLMEKEPTDISL